MIGHHGDSNESESLRDGTAYIALILKARDIEREKQNGSFRDPLWICPNNKDDLLPIMGGFPVRQSPNI